MINKIRMTNLKLGVTVFSSIFFSIIPPITPVKYEVKIAHGNSNAKDSTLPKKAGTKYQTSMTRKGTIIVDSNLGYQKVLLLNFFLTTKYSIKLAKRYAQNAIFKCWNTDSFIPQNGVKKAQ
ncbi:MAG: hypothetical protein GWP03_04765 [Proteobacteria bacterium]|nr:hypothetical protein [Pseudomonadota bacterium]